VDHRNAAGGKLLGLVVGGWRRGVHEQGQVVRPLPEEQGLMHGPRTGPEDAERPVTNLPPVAIRAVQDVTPPAFADAGDIGELVDQAGGDQEPPRADPAAVLKPDREAAAGRGELVDPSVEHLHAVATDLCPAGL